MKINIYTHIHTYVCHTSKGHPSKTNNFRKEQIKIFFLDKNLRRRVRWLTVPTKITVENSWCQMCTSVLHWFHLQLQISFNFQSLLHSESGYGQETPGSTHSCIMSHYKSSHRLFLVWLNISLHNDVKKKSNTLSLNES